MWISRLSGVVLSIGGAGLMGFLWSQALDRSGDYLLIHRIGIPGVLLLAMAAVIAFLFGAHLAIAPRSAIRRWTPAGAQARRSAP